MKKSKQKYPIDAALQLAMQLHQAGKLPDAMQRYRAILAVAPKQVDALHYLGVAEHQQGNPQAALQLIRQALQLVPDYIDAQNNLGNVLKELGLAAEAEQAFRTVLAARPQFIPAMNNLGVVLSEQGRYAEAIVHYRQVLDLKADYAEAWHNLGNALKKSGDIEASLDAYRQAIVLAPYKSHAYRDLASALAMRKRFDEALLVYRKWQELEPENPVIAHMIAAAGAHAADASTPARASDGYVQKTFDSFAESFDQVLEGLDYRAPQLTGELVATLLGQPQASLAVLDAGCGTGLCGPWLRPYAAQLTGIDLSGGMLAKAALRSQYDALCEAELTRFLQDHGAQYELIVSADTLCYFGKLDQALPAAAEALRLEGLLIFTVELQGDEAGPFVLHPHGRYSHSTAYVRQCLEQAQLEMLRLDTVVLRTESDLPVQGLLVAARRKSSNTVKPSAQLKAVQPGCDAINRVKR